MNANERPRSHGAKISSNYKLTNWKGETIIADYVHTLAKSWFENKIPEFAVFDIPQIKALHYY